LPGGIGVTPLLAMAHNLDAAGRPFTLHFATRSKARTPFVAALRQAPFASRVFFHHDDGPAAQKFDTQHIVGGLAAGTHVYLCGPGGFMEAVGAAVRERQDLVLHTEYFAAPRQDVIEDGGAFQLVLARSGIEVTVPADRSILDVLEQNGIDPPINCEQGICGTCLTKILSGAVDHRDHYLSAADRARADRMLICVSRGKADSTLVLDL
jgi:vanillate O-demethylase ferredoxin subunit